MDNKLDFFKKLTYRFLEETTNSEIIKGCWFISKVAICETIATSVCDEKPNNNNQSSSSEIESRLLKMCIFHEAVDQQIGSILHNTERTTGNVHTVVKLIQTSEMEEQREKDKVAAEFDEDGRSRKKY